MKNSTKLITHVLFLLLPALWSCSTGQQASHSTTMNAHYYSYTVQTQTLANGQEVAYTDTGSGEETLLLVHGLGSYLPIYNKLIPLLSDQYRCIAIDLPGFGKSGWPIADTLSISWYAEQLTQFIREMDLENVTLLGHSMGAQISMRLALNEEVPLQQLVLLAPAGIETFTPEEAAQMKQVMTPVSIYSQPDAQIQQNFAVNFADNQLHADAQFMYEDRLKLKADSNAYQRFATVFTQSVAAMLNGPVFQELDQLSVPTLVLFGENDLLIPNRYLHPGLTTDKVGESARDQIPNCELKMLPNCGHFVPWEQPEMVSEAILREVEVK